MTMLCDEALATPSERLLRVGQEHPEVADAHAQAREALLAYRKGDPYACLSQNELALFSAGMPPSINASAQFVGAEDPRHVFFEPIVLVSASSLAGAALVENTGTRVALMGGRVGVYAQIVQLAFSRWYGSLVEGGYEIADSTTSASAVLETEVECISIGEDALAGMDQASADYRSRRADARAEERRLRRYDRE
jgi:hypothetical protein